MKTILLFAAIIFCVSRLDAGCACSPQIRFDDCSITGYESYDSASRTYIVGTADTLILSWINSCCGGSSSAHCLYRNGLEYRSSLSFTGSYMRRIYEPGTYYAVSGCIDCAHADSVAGIWGYRFNVRSNVSSVNKLNALAFSISPNPTTTTLILQSEISFPAHTNFMLYDLTGRMVLGQEVRERSERIDVSALSKGMYLYRVVSDKKSLGSGKVVIE